MAVVPARGGGEMADAADLKSAGGSPCGFESHPPYSVKRPVEATRTALWRWFGTDCDTHPERRRSGPAEQLVQACCRVFFERPQDMRVSVGRQADRPDARRAACPVAV